MLRIEEITVSISAVTILRNLSLAVQSGTIAGLVGRNGAGKTTTMRSIMGLIELNGGRIRLDEMVLETMSAHSRARLGIGYLPEDRRLVGALSVHDNLVVPAQASGLAESRSRLQRVFNLLPELQELAGRKAVTLSGGQQKLVALARSFVLGRRLLLLDEPFEGVSTALSRRLAQVIREFQKMESGVAVLVAESDLKRAAMLTQQAFVIERGEIVEKVSLQVVRDYRNASCMKPFGDALQSSMLVVNRCRAGSKYGLPDYFLCDNTGFSHIRPGTTWEKGASQPPACTACTCRDVGRALAEQGHQADVLTDDYAIVRFNWALKIAADSSSTAGLWPDQGKAAGGRSGGTVFPEIASELLLAMPVTLF